MRKSRAKKGLVLVAILSIMCLGGVSHAGDMSDRQQAGTLEKALMTASRYNLDMFITATASRSTGGDGAACSSNDECSSNVCEGGSCCTDYGASCDFSSHCCGHQSCTNGTCPN